MADVILLILLVCVLYFLLCLLIAFVRAMLPGKRSRRSRFKDTFWTFFSGDPESPQLVLTAAGQRDPVTAKNRPGQMTGAVRLAYSAS